MAEEKSDQKQPSRVAEVLISNQPNNTVWYTRGGIEKSKELIQNIGRALARDPDMPMADFIKTQV